MTVRPSRVVAAKEHARRRVAEDDDGFRPFTIVVSEIPAAPEGDRQRPVVTGGDGLEAHGLVVVERLARRLQRVDLQVDAEWNTGRRRGRIDHAGQLARAVDDVGQGRPHVGRRRSGTRALKNLRREHALGAESRIDAHDVDEAPDEQRRADEQHDGQRDLGDDQRRTGATAAAARAAATGTLAERGRERGTGSLQRRSDARDESRHQRGDRRDREHARIDADRRRRARGFRATRPPARERTARQGRDRRRSPPPTRRGSRSARAVRVDRDWRRVPHARPHRAAARRRAPARGSRRSRTR